MRNILDIAKHGGEQLDMDIRVANTADISGLDKLAGTLRRFPKQQIEAETAAGVKKNIGVHTLLLSNVKVFELLRQAAVFEPVVYARAHGREVMGMLSANYDEKGISRLPFIKIIPLKNPYPLTSKQQVDPRMATMLAGAASGERRGVGGHGGKVSRDPEHLNTIYGALSLNQPDIAISHKNHQIRRSSSVATGLTDGRLGTLFAPDRALSDFPGFDNPLTIHPGAAGKNDAVFMPESFIDNLDSYGVTYDNASRVMLGASLRILYERRGQAVSAQIQSLSERVR